jgi:hypothetical protein
MTLLSHEQTKLDSFKHQTRDAQEQILSAAIRDPKTSGPLIIAYREAMQALYDAQDRPKKNPERRSDPTMRRGLGYAVLGDTALVAIFPLLSDARAFAQAIADQTQQQLRIVHGSWTFTPDAT